MSVGFGNETERMGAWDGVDKAEAGMVCGDVNAVTERGRSRACPAGPFMALMIMAWRNGTNSFARRRKKDAMHAIEAKS